MGFNFLRGNHAWRGQLHIDPETLVVNHVNQPLSLQYPANCGQPLEPQPLGLAALVI